MSGFCKVVNQRPLALSISALIAVLALATVAACYIPFPRPQVSSADSPPFLLSAEKSHGDIPDETGCVEKYEATHGTIRVPPVYTKLLECLTEYYAEPFDCSTKLRGFLVKNNFSCVDDICAASVVEIYPEEDRFSSAWIVIIKLNRHECIESIHGFL